MQNSQQKFKLHSEYKPTGDQPQAIEELVKGFKDLPFIVIDMVVASTLMSMGMMMLPPTTISLPFKLLLFVLADGWNLVIGQLVNSFN